MKYSPLLSELARLPWQVTGLRKADVQHKTHHVLCLGTGGSQWIIDEEDLGGLYQKPVYHWHNPVTKAQGYGTLELVAAMRNTTLEGENLRLLCKDMVENMCAEGAIEQYPELLVRDYRTKADTPQSVVTIGSVVAEFSPQDLYALGCLCTIKPDGSVEFGFSPNGAVETFQPSDITRDFNIRPILSVTLPSKEINGEQQSEVLHSTPWNPIFVAFVDDELRYGCVFRPAMDEAPIVFSRDDATTTRKVAGWLGGDRVFRKSVELATSNNTGFSGALAFYELEEKFQEYRTVWKEDEDGKCKRQYELIESNALRADSIIYCATPQDAVAIYYHLNSLRYTYPNSDEQDRYYHVAFHYGFCDLTKNHHAKLRRFANKVYTSYPNSDRALRASRNISRKFRRVYRIELPVTFKDIAHRWHNWLFSRPVNSVRDFFVAYRMTRDEFGKYDGCLALLYQRQMTSALNTMVFELKEKRDKNGQIQEEYYVVNSSNVCEYLAGEGYARDIDPLSTDKIGRYVHVDGVFADEIDPKSMLVVAREALMTLAKDTARVGTDDYEKMLKAITLATREVNEATMAKLPAITLDYKSGYGRRLQHFFYQNGALRVTPDEITFLPYERLYFNVDRREILPWDFQMPFKDKKNDQFNIEQNPEYVEREKELREQSLATDENGVSVYSSQEIAQKRSELMQWGSVHEWKVDFFNRKPRELWAPLQVLRGFANIHWEDEEIAERTGVAMTDEQMAETNAHFANIIFAIGRALWRFRSSASNSALYLTEDSVIDERKASGGSGKSSLVNVFIACSVNVLKIDGKNIRTGQNTAMLFSQFVEHQHGLIHWEDMNKNADLKSIYNYITSGFTYERKFIDAKSMGLNESPGHIITSNYSPTDLDDSSMRRTVMVPFSDRFCGENPINNTPARLITAVMPDFSPNGPESLSQRDRNQIAWINAKAVQFVMRYDRRVNAPQQNIKHRVLVRTLGDTFVAWAQSFFAQEQIYGFPIDLESCRKEFVDEFADPSENRKGDYSLKKFREKVTDFIRTLQVTMNPEHLYESGSKAEKRRYFAMRTWVRHTYFDGREWENDDTIEPKTIRVKENSPNVVFFYRKSDMVPENYADLKRRAKEAMNQLDPLPIMDSEGNVVTLTESEIERLKRSNARKQGVGNLAGGAEKAVSATEVYDDKMPF